MYRVLIGALFFCACAALAYALPASQGAEQVRRVTEIMTRKAQPQLAASLDTPSAYAPRKVSAAPAEPGPRPAEQPLKVKAAKPATPRLARVESHPAPALSTNRIVVASSITKGPARLARPSDADARADLVKSLQSELVRVGCYTGPLNARWTGRAKTAMSTFVSNVNARLPTADPDYILLALLRGHGGSDCGVRRVRTQVVNADPAPVVAKSRTAPVALGSPRQPKAPTTDQTELRSVVAAAQIPTVARLMPASRAAPSLRPAPPAVTLPNRRPVPPRASQTGAKAKKTTKPKRPAPPDARLRFAALDVRLPVVPQAAPPEAMSETPAAPAAAVAQPDRELEARRKLVRDIKDVARRERQAKKAIAARRAAQRKARQRTVRAARSRARGVEARRKRRVAAAKRKRARARAIQRRRRIAARRVQRRVARARFRVSRRAYRPRRVRKPRFNARTFFAQLEKRIK
ncbi:MAG: hypothetical protein AAFV26_03585 [Pseudomonadota bacterium]